MRPGCGKDRRWSRPALVKPDQPHVTQLEGHALELEPDPAFLEGAAGDAVLHHAVDADLDRVAAAGDVALVPLARGFFAVRRAMGADRRGGAGGAGQRLGEG